MNADAVFRALADASRQLLDRLHRRNGQALEELCQGIDMSRQAVTKREIAERWIGKFERSRLSALSKLKEAIEGEDHV
jgi:hypothetical protein